MYDRLEQCPICKNTKLDNFLICKDHLVTHESFALVRCANCHTILTNPRPDKENISKYYQSKDYISHNNKASRPINYIYKWVRQITLRQKVRIIKDYTTSKRLLDFGCGSGVFVSHANKHNFYADGLEPDPEANKLAQQLAKKTIFSFLDQLEKVEKYDIITAWHVLEHVPEPKETLNTLRKNLDDQGFIFLALPNYDSPDAQIYSQFWAGYDVPRHLSHFNQKAVQTLAEKCKLKVINTHPMFFDSYYVSLLSEKWQNTNSVFKAMKNGLSSNRIARKNGQYSSLIYVLSK